MRIRFNNWPMLGSALLLMLLTACTHAPGRNPLATWVPSNNYEPRRPILIVIHATEQESVQRSLDTLRSRNRGGPVSAHYLIGRAGHRYQLVADDQRAWHAGAGYWGTITDVNSVSIGIELDNDGVAPFPAEQIDSLLVLLEDLWCGCAYRARRSWRIPISRLRARRIRDRSFHGSAWRKPDLAYGRRMMHRLHRPVSILG
jgi:N-acetylmuramoyl-L-alanine amidase